MDSCCHEVAADCGRVYEGIEVKWIPELAEAVCTLGVDGIEVGHAVCVKSMWLMRRVLLIFLIIRRAYTVVAAVKVGDIMWIHTARSQSIRSRKTRMNMVMQQWVSAQLTIYGRRLHIMITVLLSTLALRNNARHLVQPAVGTRSAMLNNIAPHFPRSTALASFRCSPLHWSSIGARAKTSTGSFTLRAGIWRAVVLRGGRRVWELLLWSGGWFWGHTGGSLVVGV